MTRWSLLRVHGVAADHDSVESSAAARLRTGRSLRPMTHRHTCAHVRNTVLVPTDSASVMSRVSVEFRSPNPRRRRSTHFLGLVMHDVRFDSVAALFLLTPRIDAHTLRGNQPIVIGSELPCDGFDRPSPHLPSAEGAVPNVVEIDLRGVASGC